ncbi:MAG: ATP-binding protein [Lachnospiraceae bacterium]|nr:ATP-binding protein [Lachnospiraceae bacterium]
MRTDEMILYKKTGHMDIVTEIAGIESSLTDLQSKDLRDDLSKRLDQAAGRIIEAAYEFGYSGNLWQMLITGIIANNENPYSKSAERRGEVNGSINNAALHDFEIFKELFDFDVASLDQKAGTGCMRLIADYDNPDSAGQVFNKRIRDRIFDLSKELDRAGSVNEFKDRVDEFYKEYGVGKFGLNKAFRVYHDRNDEVIIKPIRNIAHVNLEDLIGYEAAKQKLIDNTEAFVNGRRANNCLLFGAAGTGKSSSIKGIVNRYFDRGLRMIEIYRHQFKDLNEVIAQVKNRNYRFIIYMDDLSFEDFETDYKYLKAVIEGGLEKKPDNILIYATSNRRHLIKESFSDRNDMDDELHASDTVQEKISLSSRFGVTIYFGSPDRKEFNEIVKGLAKRFDIKLSEEELLSEANKWELSHGGLSGRTAQSFIDYLAGRE